VTTLSAERVVAMGSVTGRAHRLAERDGQDGCAAFTRGHVAAAIVTDGCGSGRASEVGARLGAALLAASIDEHFGRGLASVGEARSAAADVTRALVARLEKVATVLGRDARVEAALVGEMLLFSFLAAVVAGEVAIVFGVGDGLAFVDEGARTMHVRIDPGPDNAPPYAAYALLGRSVEPRVLFAGRAEGVDTLAVATDGAEALSNDEIASIARDGRYAKNASLLRKRLVVLASEGRFADDATIGVVQRRRA
jgi:serine/threonine protein phosphatase PrpC